MSRTPAEARVYTVLTTTAAITAIVGARVYPVVAKQAAALPQLVYRRVSTDRVSSFAGESHLEFVRVQVDCQASTHLAAKNLAHAVLDAMDAATTFKSLPDGQVDGYDSDPEIYTVSLDFQVANDEE
jgi:hypothetical protein